MSGALRVTVLGAGNWGTTLAHCVARNGHQVRLWSRSAETCDAINNRHEHPRSLPGIALAPSIHAVSSLAEALGAPDLILLAVPSQSLRGLCRELAPLLAPEHLLVHGIKGLESESHARMSQVLREETCLLQLGVLSGPNLAPEIAAGQPAGTVIATRFPRIVVQVRRALASAHLRVFESHDPCGVELCGAIKNVVAIASGMADELQLGANAKAFLLTRGLAELTRLLSAYDGDPGTALGLAGCGDLMATAQSPISRNHRVGAALARGLSLHQAVAEIGMVAEGVLAARSVCALADARGLELPLIATVARVLQGELTVVHALAALLELPTGHDVPSCLRRGD
jgi:glycerol-3-phosphate dehydrogenase (NAD(P)+)